MALQMDAAALNAFLAREFPQLEGAFTVLDANEAGLTARLPGKAQGRGFEVKDELESATQRTVFPVARKILQKSGK